MNQFLEKYADSIICQPSGMTYSELKAQRTQRIIIVNQNEKNQVL